MSSPSPFQAGDRVAGRYELLALVGEGPLGEVWKAIDRELGLEVALKFLNPRYFETVEQKDVLEGQLRTSRKLFHTHLARMTDQGAEKNWPFYVTSFVRGQSLKALLDGRRATGRPFGSSEIETFMGQICGALSAAHRGNVFSNLKPQNVIIGQDVLAVRDIGLGLLFPAIAYGEAQKGAGMLAYLAPEIARGQRPDVSSDVFSLGVLLGELVAFVVPDPMGARPELAKFRPEISGAIEELYLRALSEDPKARCITPLVFFDELRTALRGDRPSVLPQAAEGPRVDQTLLVHSSSLPFIHELPLPGEPPTRALPRPSGLEDSESTRPLDITGAPTQVLEMFSPPGAEDASSAATQLLDVLPPALGTGILPSVSYPPSQPLQRPSSFSHAWPTPLFRLAALTLAAFFLGGGLGLWVVGHLRHSVGRRLWPGATGTRLAKAGFARSPVAAPSLCPEGMKHIPPGEFQMGTSASDPYRAINENAVTTVKVPGFCIDQFEYPNQKGVRPVANESWRDAQRLCAIEHKRLCTEAEWERACKGPRDLRFPYGQNFVFTACLAQRGPAAGPVPSGSVAGCRSDYEVEDLSGNLAEWTYDSAGSGRVLRGGSFKSPARAAKCSARVLTAADTRSPEVGFRCCREAGEENR